MDFEYVTLSTSLGWSLTNSSIAGWESCRSPPPSMTFSRIGFVGSVGEPVSSAGALPVPEDCVFFSGSPQAAKPTVMAAANAAMSDLRLMSCMWTSFPTWGHR